MYEDDAYKIGGYDIRPQKWFCPNCSELIVAYPDASGKARKRCCNCGAAMTRYKKKRGTNVIEVTEPERYRAY